MNFCPSRFNTYLLLTALLAAGCQSDQSKAEKQEAKKLSALRINIETKDDNLGMGADGTTTTIQFLKAPECRRNPPLFPAALVNRQLVFLGTRSMPPRVKSVFLENEPDLARRLLLRG